ncbi:MAG TPA: outer membrane beta-barrel protein [Candidatus Krumholzibacteria bacterium]
MRRSIITVAVAILVALALAPRANAEAYAGFRGGMNISSFSGEGQFAPFGPPRPGAPPPPFPASAFPATEYADSRTGFTGAVFIGFDKGRYGFRTEMMYTQKGAASGEASVKLDYVEMAPLFVFKQPLSSGFALRAFAGPVVGLFVNAEVDNGPIDVDIGDIVEHLELSGTIGAELDVKAGPYWVIFDARYTAGTSVFEGENLEGDDLIYGTVNPTEFDASNTGISISAGLMIPF